MKYYTKVREYNLKATRNLLGISTRAFAKMVGADYSYLYRLENGGYEATPQMALKIFSALKKHCTKLKLIENVKELSSFISELV